MSFNAGSPARVSPPSRRPEERAAHTWRANGKPAASGQSVSPGQHGTGTSRSRANENRGMVSEWHSDATAVFTRVEDRLHEVDRLEESLIDACAEVSAAVDSLQVSEDGRQGAPHLQETSTLHAREGSAIRR